MPNGDGGTLARRAKRPAVVNRSRGWTRLVPKTQTEVAEQSLLALHMSTSSDVFHQYGKGLFVCLLNVNDPICFCAFIRNSKPEGSCSVAVISWDLLALICFFLV